MCNYSRLTCPECENAWDSIRTHWCNDSRTYKTCLGEVFFNTFEDCESCCEQKQKKFLHPEPHKLKVGKRKRSTQSLRGKSAEARMPQPAEQQTTAISSSKSRYPSESIVTSSSLSEQDPSEQQPAAQQTLAAGSLTGQNSREPTPGGSVPSIFVTHPDSFKRSWQEVRDSLEYYQSIEW